MTVPESLGYEVGAADLCAAGVGAPHIRQRLYWVANAHNRRRPARSAKPQSPTPNVFSGQSGERIGRLVLDGAGRDARESAAETAGYGRAAESAGGTGRLADAERPRRHGRIQHGDTAGQCGLTDLGGAGRLGDAARDDEQRERESAESVRRSSEIGGPSAGGGSDSRLADDLGTGLEKRDLEKARGECPAIERTGADCWNDFELIPCADGKARRVESGTFPLVAGLPRGVVPSGDPSVSEAQATAEFRVARLRGYGNSIVPQLAAEFILAAMEVTHDR